MKLFLSDLNQICETFPFTAHRLPKTNVPRILVDNDYWPRELFQQQTLLVAIICDKSMFCRHRRRQLGLCRDPQYDFRPKKQDLELVVPIVSSYKLVFERVPTTLKEAGTIWCGAGCFPDSTKGWGNHRRRVEIRYHPAKNCVLCGCGR